jgi:hypothetical protein
MPIATKLDTKKDLKPVYAPPTYPVLVEVPQLRYVVMPLEGLFWADGTDRYATCGPLPGCGHRRWSASASRVGLPVLAVPPPPAWSAWAGRRKRCKFLATPALYSPDGIAGWTGKIEGSARDRGRSGVSAVFPDHLQDLGPSAPRASCGRRVR